MNIYAPNTRTTTFIKATLLKLKTHIEPHTIVMGDFNNPLSLMGRLLKQNLKTDILKLVEAMNQINLTDIYRTFNPRTKYLLQN
jgi:endonuclease/exonuclease/phosphatase family metal-dependent hydrolase